MIKISQPLSIIIADDDSYYTFGLERGLKSINHKYTVKIAANGKQLIGVLAASKIDVAIVDYLMPEMDGLEAVQIINEKYPHIKIIFNSLITDPLILKVILSAGIHAYVLKDAHRNDMQRAFEAVCKDELFLSAPIIPILIEHNAKIKQSEKFINEKNKLTDREKDIMLLMIAGVSSKQISEKLFISEKTVNTHRHNIHDKTGTRTFAEMTCYAILHGYIIDLKFFTTTNFHVERILKSMSK